MTRADAIKIGRSIGSGVGGAVGVVIIAALVVAIFAAIPAAAIWSVNTLVPAFGIPHSLKTYVAMWIFFMVFTRNFGGSSK